MSIRRKLMAIIMAVSIGMLGLASFIFIVNEAVTFRRQIQQELSVLANIIGINTTAAITFGDRMSATKTLDGLRAKPFILSAYIITPEGEVFAKYLATGVDTKRVTYEHPEGERLEKDGEHLAKSIKDSEEWWSDWDGDVDVVNTIVFDNQPIGVVIIKSDLRELISRLKWFFIMANVIMIGSLVFAYFLSNKLQRPISDPILGLVHTMRAVTAEKNYSIRASEHGNDEIGQLIKGFNEMLAQIQVRDVALERYTLELQDSNADLKSFIYSAAHDLRQPLVNIKGFNHELVSSLQEIQTLLHRNSESLPESDRNRLAAIFEDDIQAATGFVGSSVERMASLIDALLKLSQAGSRTLRPEAIAMESLVKSSIRSLRQQIEEKHITMIVGDLPDVTADRIALDQIMGNLLDNAVKYLDGARPGRIEISGERTEAGVIYQVRDNGRGIAAGDIHKVFDLFRRAGTQEVPGMGVGLAFVRSLVRLHGGRIWCESEADVGSTFSFIIPRDHHLQQNRQKKV